ncbi:TIR domain-containing protein [Pseudenhygromyxa sp. WMMC2535]|uniref:pYEATS domain-containing protein n=1 Tax=Pseudenhygromyxa sp. WMMC2535 TaxID=2712867 RepID=UPI001557D147|nr:TIR domain-containing protein [Pseudenhygromyxa sp. WMMC2535]
MRPRQSAQAVGEGYWRWAIWIEGTPEELAEIEEVIYHLHPTFSPAIVTRSDPGDGFRIEREGWGVFVVGIEVRLRGGAREVFRHMLDFAEPAPLKEVAARPDRLRVFVSYARDDDELAREVKRRIEEAGFTTWIYRDELRPGEDWRWAMREQLESSDVVVALSSDIPSRWMAAEAEQARRLGKPVLGVGDERLLRDFVATDRVVSLEAGALEGALLELSDERSKS